MLLTLNIFFKQVIVYNNDSPKARYNVLEEVKDVQYNPPFMFTVRDLYVTATEIQPGELFKLIIKDKEYLLRIGATA